MALGAGPPFAVLIDGGILMPPSPFRSHQQIVVNLILGMGNHLDANGIPGKLLPLVHPDSETIEIFDFAKRQDEPVSVVENGTHPAISTPLLPGLELLLSRVFRQ